MDYEIKICDDPNEVKNIIFEKNKENNKSRILAGYCWDWPKEGRNNPEVYEIKIPEFNFEMSWNLEKTKTWAIDQDSVEQIGCVHTAQRIEFDYVGVIIGNDLRYEDGKLVTDYTKRASTDKSLFGIKGIAEKDSYKAEKIADEIIKNTYRTLMTRGQKGCYVYCTDKKLSEYLKMKLEQRK